MMGAPPLTGRWNEDVTDGASKGMSPQQLLHRHMTREPIAGRFPRPPRPGGVPEGYSSTAVGPAKCRSPALSTLPAVCRRPDWIERAHMYPWPLHCDQNGVAPPDQHDAPILSMVRFLLLPMRIIRDNGGRGVHANPLEISDSAPGHGTRRARKVSAQGPRTLEDTGAASREVP
jgi:hypothetical protein